MDRTAHQTCHGLRGPIPFRSMTPEPVGDKPPLLLRKGLWFGVACAVPLLLCALWLAEDWRGRRQLAETKARLAAAGLDLSPAALWPGRVRDEMNVCATPAIMDLWRPRGSRRVTSPIGQLVTQLREIVAIEDLSGLRVPDSPDWGKLITVRRKKMAAFKPPRLPLPGSLLAAVPGDSPRPEYDLATALEGQLTGLIAELEPRVDLPAAQLSPTIHSLPSDIGRFFEDLPWDRPLHDLFQVLTWRAHLALATGDPERGVKSWRILWRFAEALPEPGLEGAATGNRCRAGNWLWTALRQRQLTEAQLTTVGKDAAKLDAVAGTREDLRRKLARLASDVESMKSDLSQRSWIFDGHGSTWRSSLGYAVPAGWLDANLAHCYELTWTSLNDLRRTGVGWSLLHSPVTVPMSKANRLARHERLAGVCGARDPNWSRTDLARNHVIASCSVVACALERYFLVHQKYPTTLRTLDPGLLAAVPTDLDGLPLRYAPEPRNGRYKLWSVGINGTDEGGRADKDQGSKWSIFYLRTGDWVWEYPLGK